MAINLKFPLRSYRKGFYEGNNTIIDATRENIKILITTRTGERLINPRLGLPRGLDEILLFETTDTNAFTEIAKRHINTALKEHLPNVKLLNLEVYDENNIPAGIYPLKNNEILIRMYYEVFIDEGEGAQPIQDQIQLRINPNETN